MLSEAKANVHERTVNQHSLTFTSRPQTIALLATNHNSHLDQKNIRTLIRRATNFLRRVYGVDANS